MLRLDSRAMTDYRETYRSHWRAEPQSTQSSNEPLGGNNDLIQILHASRERCKELGDIFEKFQ